MPEEANEHLIKLYLESKDFLVLTNHKVKVASNKVLEVDIIAVRYSKIKKDALPNRIIGEVKAWKIRANNFKSCYDKKKPNSGNVRDSFKIINNYNFRKIVNSNIENKYGRGFKFCVFADVVKADKKKIENFFKKEGITLIPYNDIVTDIIKYARSKTYSNDPELQLIRLMDKSNVLNKNGQ